MDQQNDIESLWQRVYQSSHPDVVLAEFFNHNPPEERERLLRRCYETGEQFGSQLEQQELNCYTALAYIYTFGLQTCSAQQLQITPSPAVAKLIKDRRYQLYSSIQRRPGWKQFPYNITPSGIWRYKNKKNYLGQEILRLYGKLAYRTPDFDTALAILTREYQSGGKKRLTKLALSKIVVALPTTVPVHQTSEGRDNDSPVARVGASHGRNNGSPAPNTPQGRNNHSPAPDTPRDRNNSSPVPDTPPNRNNSSPDRNNSSPDRNNSSPDRNNSSPDRNNSSPDRNYSPNIDIERQRRGPRESLAGDDISDVLGAHNSQQSEQDDLLNNRDQFSDFFNFADNTHTGTPPTRRSSSLSSKLGDQTLQNKNMNSQNEQQRKRQRPVHEDLLETPASAFQRVITDAIATAKQYDCLAVEISHLEVTLQGECSSSMELQSRWQAACTARSKAETNVAAQKQIYTSLQEDGHNALNLTEEMAGLLDRFASRVMELGHQADALKIELDKSEERVSNSRDSIKKKVAEMMKIGQNWGWSGQNSQAYDAYHWIGKTFGKAGAEDRCKEIDSQLAGSSTDGG
ncbi:hypothetical protein BLS_010054 [Venturia inaequalis]|uniref:Uncharacterized protein n=1 Tax=Venturia inaequalis TaxID=5025 RepID=A0A8H3U3J4_VENIN|nr:hypothetical protein BLS_010054 [Venturia inaequalis]